MKYFRKPFRTHYTRRAYDASPRDIIVKYPGKCCICGETIEVGRAARYWPANEGNPAKIHHPEVRGEYSCPTRQGVDHAANDYAGEGLDARWEDDFARECGL